MTATSSLTEAQADLEAYLHALENTDDEDDRVEARFVSPMVGVVDHARRVLLDESSTHYRCDKVGELVAEAIRVQTAAFAALAEHANSRVQDRIDELGAELTATHDRIRAALWEVAT